MNNSIAAFFSGLSFTIIGHPLDTLKTWKQNNNNLLNNPSINLKPKDLLKYKIIDQVVNFRDITPLELKNLESYYELDTLTSNYNNIPKTKKINKKNKKRNNK